MDTFLNYVQFLYNVFFQVCTLVDKFKNLSQKVNQKKSKTEK